MRVVSFVPIKLNNLRLPGKNTKPLFDGTPLCSLLFKTIASVKKIDEKYCYCSDASIQEFLPADIQFLKRPKELDSNTTLSNDIIESFIKTVDSDIYVLMHATSPFLSKEVIEECIDKVTSGDYNSAFSVCKSLDFLWDSDGNAINFDPSLAPRSQDLKPMYRETNGIFVFRKNDFLKTKRRVGENPYMAVVDAAEALDVNDPIDFTIIDSVYAYRKNKELQSK